MKLKDLGKGQNLLGIKVKTPNGVVGYWKSQWNQGVWLSSEIGGSRAYPQFVDNLYDCREWEITEEEVNCHIETNYDIINNKKDKQV